MLPMMRRRIHEVPLCPQVLYHLPTCLPLPYLKIPFPLPNPWWPFHCLHWWLCPIRVHVSTVLAVESLLGWGMEIWFPKDCRNLTQKTETCVVSMFSCPCSFCLSFWTLFCLRPSSNEFQALRWKSALMKKWWKVLLKSSSTGLQRSCCICWQNSRLLLHHFVRLYLPFFRVSLTSLAIGNAVMVSLKVATMSSM